MIDLDFMYLIKWYFIFVDIGNLIFILFYFYIWDICICMGYKGINFDYGCIII